MPPILTGPVRLVLIVLAAYLVLRLALPDAFFDATGLTQLESDVAGVVGPPLAVLGLYEVAVVVSAVLDYREAKLNVVGWRQAWGVAHVTVLVRVWRRTQWTATGLNITRKQLVASYRARRAARDAAREYVVLDPTQPFDGVVVDPRAEDEDAA